jgi:hypothetical protein
LPTPNRTILTGENPFIRLSSKDGDPNSTDASYWRIIHCPMGPGHVLYVKSELTDGRWRIYSDNIAMARWLQRNRAGHAQSEPEGPDDSGHDAAFEKSGDPRYFWTEHVSATTPRDCAYLVRHRRAPADPHQPNRRRTPPLRRVHLAHPALGARLTVDWQRSARPALAREREGQPFSTCALAFSESWTEAR